MKSLLAHYRLGDLCAAFDVSRSGFHRFQTAQPSRRAGEDAHLADVLCELHAQSRKTYGRPRLTIALRQGGRRHSPKRVARLMQDRGLRGVQRGQFKPQTTDSRHEHGIAPNLRPGPGAGPTQPDKIWAADFTYIPTAEGWLYVAGVMDQGSRQILGLGMGARIDARLAEAALKQAIARRGGHVHDLLHHTDRGVQYASLSYRQLLAESNLTASMSRRANCYDNAHMESFWGTLKAELVAGRSFATRDEARLAIFEYVEVFYNRQRLHSALGFLSPVDFENQHH
jgi:transposase InsO family protein